MPVERSLNGLVRCKSVLPVVAGGCCLAWKTSRGFSGTHGRPAACVLKTPERHVQMVGNVLVVVCSVGNRIGI